MPKYFNKKSKKYSDYYILSEPQKISLGHDMCGGEFSFDEDTDYEVQFGLMDASGNENLKLTEPVEFKSPTQKDESENEFECNCTKNSALNTAKNDKSNVLMYLIFAGISFAIGISIYLKRKMSVAKKQL